jgi:lambda family phage minor tail protein L
MPYVVTDSFEDETQQLSQDQLLEMYVLDLASVHGNVTFSASDNKIISTDRDGLFSTTRILNDDILEVSGTSYNNGFVTITNITNRELTVSESLIDESNVEVFLTNYLYYVKAQHNIYGYKMENSSIVNTNQLYTAINVVREDTLTDIQRVNKSATMKASIANVNRVPEILIQNRAYLRGCFLYIWLSYVKHLPSGGTYEYVGTTPDYLANMVDKFVIDNAMSNVNTVSFDCRYKFHLKDIQLPRRKIHVNNCAWVEKYKGAECDPDDNINDTTYPTCDGSLSDCRERGNSLRFGGFPGVPKQGLYLW